MPLPGSDEPHQDEASSPSLDAIVITGVGPPLNEHLARASAVEVRTDDGEATAGPFFPLSDELAPEAWQGALRSTVERGLQGGTVADDDDDLNWEDVVYDPAHAAELEAVPATRAPTAESANFTQLSSSVLADLYNVEDDDDDASPATPAPSSAPSSSSSLTTLPPARLGGDAPMATLSHKDLVELLFAGDEDRVERAGRELVSRGLAAVPALGERFPGRLRVDPFDPGENVRSADRLGPLIDVLARLGADGLDAAIPHIDSRYPAHRFAAVLLFQVTPDPRAIDLLRSRLHDAEPRVQRLAAEALVPFLAHPRFESLLVHLRERATATHKPYPLEARRRAAELLGEFRDVGSVPLLIGLLNGVEMQETARKALRTITVADMGARPKAWEKWWQRAKKRSRLDWLIESLGSEELALRTAAHRELRDLAGDDFGYRPDADKRARQRAIDVWQQWWTEEQQRTVHPKAASQV